MPGTTPPTCCTSVDTAEKLKIEYGTTAPKDISERDTVDLSAISRSDTQVVGKRMLADIVAARYTEILEMARDELAKIDRDGALPAGAILTGAGSKIPGLTDLARDTLRLPVAIGFPEQIEGMVDRVDDPSFATAIGLLRLSVHGPARRYGAPALSFGSIVPGIQAFFKRLLP